MSEITGLAFLLCSRGRDKGVKNEQIVWLVEQQLEHLDSIEFVRKLEEEFLGVKA
jgi:hypothetical protein